MIWGGQIGCPGGWDKSTAPKGNAPWREKAIHRGGKNAAPWAPAIGQAVQYTAIERVAALVLIPTLAKDSENRRQVGPLPVELG